MLIVVDANVVFSALMRGGKPLKVFELNEHFEEFEFIAPEFLFFEIGKRIDNPLTTFEDKVNEAEDISPHMKDVSYIALSLKLNCSILSGDRGLKNCLPDRVVTPSETVDILLGRKNKN